MCIVWKRQNILFIRRAQGCKLSKQADNMFTIIIVESSRSSCSKRIAVWKISRQKRALEIEPYQPPTSTDRLFHYSSRERNVFFFHQESFVALRFSLHVSKTTSTRERTVIPRLTFSRHRARSISSYDTFHDNDCPFLFYRWLVKRSDRYSTRKFERRQFGERRVRKREQEDKNRRISWEGWDEPLDECKFHEWKRHKKQHGFYSNMWPGMRLRRLLSLHRTSIFFFVSRSLFHSISINTMHHTRHETNDHTRQFYLFTLQYAERLRHGSKNHRLRWWRIRYHNKTFIKWIS